MFKSPVQSPPGSPSSSSSSVINSTSNGSNRYNRPPSVVVETLYATTSENSAGQKRINQYTLQKEIGHGAFGTVHLANDTSGNCYVCIFLFVYIWVGMFQFTQSLPPPLVAQPWSLEIRFTSLGSERIQ
jgi:hypothetical protein